VLFGGLQKINREAMGLSLHPDGAANSSGGCYGQDDRRQSIVGRLHGTTGGHEGSILRFVFWHSIALACLVGVYVHVEGLIFHGDDHPSLKVETWHAEDDGEDRSHRSRRRAQAAGRRARRQAARLPLSGRIGWLHADPAVAQCLQQHDQSRKRLQTRPTSSTKP